MSEAQGTSAVSTVGETPAQPASSPVDSAQGASGAAGAEAKETKGAAPARKGRDAIFAEFMRGERTEPAVLPAVPKAEAAAEEGGKPEEKRPPGFLRKRMEALRAELEAAKKETRGAYIDELKKEPGRIFRDIDDPELLLKLAEARGRQLSPEERVRYELEQKIAAVEAKLTEERTRAEQVSAQSREAQQTHAMADVIVNGADDGDAKIAAGKWPVATRLVKAGEPIAREANRAVQKLIADLGRAPSKRETASIVEIVMDQVEKREAARAKLYADTSPPAAAPAKPAMAGRTLSAKRAGGGGYATEKLSEVPKGQRRTEILRRMRDGSLT